MKPLSIVFIALLCVCILATSVFAFMIKAAADQVVFQEEVLIGSSENANGLFFRYEASYENFQYWDCRYTFGGDLFVDSYFRVGGNPDHLREYVEEYPGIILYDDNGYNYNYYAYTSSTLQGLAKAWAELYRDTELETTGEKQFRVKDYCAFYPLRVKLITDAGTLNYSSIYANANYDKQITLEFNDYFRIPVLEDDHMLIYGHRYKDSIGGFFWDGTLVDPGVEGYDHFEFLTVGTATDTVSYFTFIPRTAYGEQVDTSLIPGGYGIYAVDIVKNEQGSNIISPGSLRTVCALDPSLTVAQIRTGAEEKLMHIYAWDESKLMLITFDIASGREVQRKTLLDSPKKGEHTVSYFLGQNCDLLYVDQAYYVVLTENEDGTMQQQQTVSRDKNQLPQITLQPCNICFDGERLAIVYNKQQLNFGAYGEEGYYDIENYTGSEIFISVYDASGVIYSGKFSHALEHVTEKKSLIDGVQVSCSWN